jgi:aconitate hydratase
MYTIVGISDALRPRQSLQVIARREDGTTLSFNAIARVDSPIEVDYLRHGGILPFVLRNLMHPAPAGA